MNKRKAGVEVDKVQQWAVQEEEILKGKGPTNLILNL